MSAFLDFLANTFASAVEQAYEPKLVAVLQTLHDQDPDLYQAAILGFNQGVKALIPIVAKTKTSLDDGFVNALNEVVTTSAAANGVALP